MKEDFARIIFTEKTFVIILIINDGLLIVVSRNLGVISDHLVWFCIFLQLFFSPISFLVFWRIVWKKYFKMWKESKFFSSPLVVACEIISLVSRSASWSISRSSCSERLGPFASIPPSRDVAELLARFGGLWSFPKVVF